MQPTLALREQMAALLAADATTLAPAMNANKIFLVMNNIVPTEQSVLADMTAATFTGSGALLVGTGAQEVALDPANNDAIIDLLPPTTGFRWVTGDAVNLPQTIYGYALVDHGVTTLLACAKLDNAVTLTAAGQRVDIGVPNFRQAANSVS